MFADNVHGHLPHPQCDATSGRRGIEIFIHPRLSRVLTSIRKNQEGTRACAKPLLCIGHLFVWHHTQGDRSAFAGFVDFSVPIISYQTCLQERGNVVLVLSGTPDVPDRTRKSCLQIASFYSASQSVCPDEACVTCCWWYPTVTSQEMIFISAVVKKEKAQSWGMTKLKANKNPTKVRVWLWRPANHTGEARPQAWLMRHETGGSGDTAGDSWRQEAALILICPKRRKDFFLLHQRR